MSSPVSTKVISLRKPPSRLRPTLRVGGGRLAAHAGDPHPVGPVLGEADRVEAGGDVGAGVPGALRLVQQLGGDGADVDDAAGAGVLGDDAGAVGVDLGEREAGAVRADGSVQCSVKKA